MKLIKGNREAHWIPLDGTVRKQVRKKAAHTHCFVEFEGTKQEQEVAARCGRSAPRHKAWVNVSSLAEHGGV